MGKNGDEYAVCIIYRSDLFDGRHCGSEGAAMADSALFFAFHCLLEIFPGLVPGQKQIVSCSRIVVPEWKATEVTIAFPDIHSHSDRIYDGVECYDVGLLRGFSRF